MIGIIVVGHGKFAEGLTSAVELIAGKQDSYITLDFTADVTPEKLNENIRGAIKELENESGILIFTDLKGGTPFKESAEISTEYENVKVLTGTNIAMLLEASLMRIATENIDDFARSLALTGSDQVDFFDLAALNNDSDDEFDGDGI